MTIVGFNFTKINASKVSPIKGKISVQNKISIADVEKHEMSLGKSKQAGAKFIFKYVSKYEPKIGEIELEGDCLYLSDDKEIKALIVDWKKNKKISQEVMTQVLNTVLIKCNLQSLVVGKDVNLPPSVQLPKVQIKQ